MENVLAYISTAFGLITGLAVALFYRATGNSWRFLALLLPWLLLQGALALSGFYLVTDAVPPRFLLVVVPPTLVIVALFLTTRGRAYLDSRLKTKALLLLHVVRIPVELILYALFLHKVIPQLMTFEGRNWDILAGLSAPLVYYHVFRNQPSANKLLLVWELVGLALLLNIVVIAIFSAPSPVQRFAFEQPNVAILHFPFVWLPGCVVPLVLLAHLASLRQLLIKNQAGQYATPSVSG
ncbi:hypothetical protein IC235_02790 [Hymenobacter sp. BT664]|uniref:Uncharacterized protein n=1 Tax=Hymenobacter montanus TaxID=2771359 RepID=A0A927BAD6_9BACT|nr:hypothetical protein [Hymenobacter montanus]MBD2766816.1 hypothetical protein [Hymenobacter montanus]